MNANRASTAPLLAGPLFLWLIIQLLALLISATNVALSAGFPRPPSQFAVHVMLAVQMICAAMLFPYLLRDWRAAAAVIATALSMLLLAGMLAGAEPARTVLAWIFVATWLIGLALWRAALPTKFHLHAVAVMSLVAIGGPIIWYLRAEFARDPIAIPQTTAWGIVGAFAILGFLARIIRSRL